VNLTEWGKSVKVAPNEVKFASTWLWSSFSNLWRAYKIIVEIHAQQNSPHGFTAKIGQVPHKNSVIGMLTLKASALVASKSAPNTNCAPSTPQFSKATTLSATHCRMSRPVAHRIVRRPRNSWSSKPFITGRHCT